MNLNDEEIKVMNRAIKSVKEEMAKEKERNIAIVNRNFVCERVRGKRSWVNEFE